MQNRFAGKTGCWTTQRHNHESNQNKVPLYEGKIQGNTHSLP